MTKYFLELNENCYVNDWSFDNTFLFMGSVSTTIGYGHIVPKSRAGKSCCILFTVFSGIGSFIVRRLFVGDSGYIDVGNKSMLVTLSW